MKILQYYAKFEIDNVTGMACTSDQMIHVRHEKISRYQKQCFISYPAILKDFIFCAPSALNTAIGIKSIFALLDDEMVRTFCTIVEIRTFSFNGVQFNREFLIDAIVWTFQQHVSQLDMIKKEPLYPTESLIFNQNLIPSNGLSNNFKTLAIPKLNLQFLTFHDYLLRNFRLYKLEAAFSIRQDLVDAILRYRRHIISIRRVKSIRLFSQVGRVMLFNYFKCKLKMLALNG
jgi:intron-binding protein aquarius